MAKVTKTQFSARKTLRRKGIDYSLSNFFGAAYEGDAETVKLLIAAGIHFNKTAKLLTAAGIYINITALNGALIETIRGWGGEGSKEIAEILDITRN